MLVTFKIAWCELEYCSNWTFHDHTPGWYVGDQIMQQARDKRATRDLNDMRVSRCRRLSPSQPSAKPLVQIHTALAISSSVHRLHTAST